MDIPHSAQQTLLQTLHQLLQGHVHHGGRTCCVCVFETFLHKKYNHEGGTQHHTEQDTLHNKPKNAHEDALYFFSSSIFSFFLAIFRSKWRNMLASSVACQASYRALARQGWLPKGGTIKSNTNKTVGH